MKTNSVATNNDSVLKYGDRYNRTAWIRHQFGEADRWRMPQEQRAHSWSPMLSVSYDLADNHRLFARYARMSRFPSLYELTAATGSGGLYGSETVAEYSLKPEKSTNWEVGYNFNFARISPSCAKAISASPTTATKSKTKSTPRIWTAA